MNNKYKCVCCGNYTIENEDPLWHDICPVCHWENDPIQNERHDYSGGANKVSLNEAKANFVKYGVSDLRFKKNTVTSKSVEESNSKNRKYPISLFIMGLILNMFRYYWLLVPGVILLILGIFSRPCLIVGLIALVIDVAVAFVQQMILRKTLIEDSENPNFKEFQDAMFGEGKWNENVIDFVNSKINDPDDNPGEEDTTDED